MSAPRLAALPLLASLAALLLAFRWGMPATNFGGLDEWLVVELTHRGVVAVPYAFRPLGLVWALPAGALAPWAGFRAFPWAFVLYALGSAVLVASLVRRVFPESPRLAAVTAALVVAWAPSDPARLSTVDGAVYQGITLGMLASMLLFLEGCHRGRPVLAAAGVVFAFATVRCYEGTAAILAATPLLLALRAPAKPRWRWAAAWWGAVALAAGLVLAELSMTASRSAYQVAVQADYPSLREWLGRLALQYRLHLVPLVGTSWTELRTWRALAAVMAFVLLVVVTGRDGGPVRRRAWGAAVLVGLGFAGLGYAVVLLGWGNPTAYRLQFLSGPGIALAFAALAELLGSLVPRGRGVVAAALGAWVVAVGAGRTAALQGEWDVMSLHGRQVGMLSALRRAVPDVAPGTLVIALDDGRAWPGSFTFHHAVQYLYHRRASAYVPLRRDTMYSLVALPEGIRLEPWPIIRRAWDAPVVVFRYDQVVVVRHAESGEVAVLEQWPAELVALPAGAAYVPRGRVLAGPPPAVAVLEP